MTLSPSLVSVCGRRSFGSPWLIMSLDNVVAIAGVSECDPACLGVGLVLSIIMILTLRTIIMAVMNRYRWIVYVGTAILALTAAQMMQDDLEALVPAAPVHHDHASASDLSGWPLRLLVLSVCLTSNRWWPRDSPREDSEARSGSSKPVSGQDGDEPLSEFQA